MTGAVLHITSAPGGGVDRHIRDIAATVPGRHLALHVGPQVDVLEDLGHARCWPLAPGAAPDAAMTIGTRLLHLHTLDRLSRERAAAIMAAGATAMVATLHDIGFLHPALFADAPLGTPDRAWVGEVHDTLARATTVIAPSDYIRGEAMACMPDLPVAIIAPGVPRRTVAAMDAPAAFRDHAPRHVIAALGAIGPHKGSGLLRDVAAGLAACDAALVVIGYTDDTLQQGWLGPGLFVHGPYADQDLPGLMAAYHVSAVLFPNRIPESFSYALSEAWAAGTPVIVPDEGALGARVRAHGGGWLLPAGFDAGAAVRQIGRLLEAGEAEWGRVKSAIVAADPTVVPPLSAMAEALAAVYAQFELAPSDPPPADVLDHRLQRLLAANLDGFVFRQELVRLAAALRNADEGARIAKATADAAQEWATRLQADVDAAKQWARKVEADVATLTSALQARDADAERMRAQAERLALDHAALERLPRFVRRILRHRANRDRG